MQVNNRGKQFGTIPTNINLFCFCSQLSNFTCDHICASTFSSSCYLINTLSVDIQHKCGFHTKVPRGCRDGSTFISEGAIASFGHSIFLDDPDDSCYWGQLAFPRLVILSTTSYILSGLLGRFSILRHRDSCCNLLPGIGISRMDSQLILKCFILLPRPDRAVACRIGTTMIHKGGCDTEEKASYMIQKGG